MGTEMVLTKKQAKRILDGLVSDMKDDDVLYISKILCGNTKVGNEKKYIEVGMAVNPSLFKDKGKSISGLLRSNIMLLVIPNKTDVNKAVFEERIEACHR